jgi:hypothetical protein
VTSVSARAQVRDESMQFVVARVWVFALENIHLRLAALVDFHFLVCTVCFIHMVEDEVNSTFNIAIAFAETAFGLLGGQAHRLNHHDFLRVKT